MFNMGSMLKTRNVFGGQDAFSGDDPTSPDYDPYKVKEKFKRLDMGSSADTSTTSSVSDRPEGQDKNPFGDAYSKIMSEEPGPQHQAYQQALTEAPNRDNFKPGKARKLAAILAGLSGDPNASKNLLDDEYNTANEDYQQRLKRLKEGADVENADTTNKRMLYRNLLDDERARNALTERSKVDQSTIDVNGARIKKLSAPSNPTGSFKDELTGHRYAFRDGEKIDLGVVDETPQQKSDRILQRGKGLAGYTSNLSHMRYEEERGSRKQDAEDLQTHSDKLTAARQLTNAERTHLQNVARDKANPLRNYAARELAYRDIISANPKAADSIDLEKGTHLPDIDALVQQYMRKYDPR